MRRNTKKVLLLKFPASQILFSNLIAWPMPQVATFIQCRPYISKPDLKSKNSRYVIPISPQKNCKSKFVEPRVFEGEKYHLVSLPSSEQENYHHEFRPTRAAALHPSHNAAAGYSTPVHTRGCREHPSLELQTSALHTACDRLCTRPGRQCRLDLLRQGWGCW